MRVIKNIVLCLMVILCIFLSSQVWLQLPDFLSLGKLLDNEDITENQNNIGDISINIWDVVKPSQFEYKEQLINYTFSNSVENKIWTNALNSLSNALEYFGESRTDLFVGEKYPEEYIMMKFENKLPIEIFTGYFNIDRNRIKTKLSYISKIIIPTNDNNSIYLYNGDSTVVIRNNKIDNSFIANEKILEDKKNNTEYSYNVTVSGEQINVPVPVINQALNPVYVKSELDVKNKESIENIAKDYFQNKYDYVRKSEDIDGNVLYVYKNEKVLKITGKGYIDFFDSNINTQEDGNIYSSLLAALKFSSNFLTFPQNLNLSSVNTTQYNGSFGYKFVFTYKIHDFPIIFSRVRENSALEVDVIGNKVVSYKRLIREVDKTKDNIIDYNIMSVQDVISKNLKLDEDIEQQVQEDGQLEAPKVFTKDMIGKIDDIYFAYFDYARDNEQQLIVVWVINIGETKYIFNAKTGTKVESWENGI